MPITKFKTAVGTAALVAVVWVGSGIAAQELDEYGDPLPRGAVRRLGTVSMRHGGYIDCVAFLPDGKSVVSGAADGTVRVWDAATGKQTRVFETTTNGIYGGPRFAVSPDGKTLAAAAPSLCDVDLYDLTTGRKTGVVGRADVGGESTHTGNVHAVAFFPEGHRLASYGGEKVKIWRLPNVTLLEFDKFDDQIACVAVSPDGKTVACGTEFGNGWVLLWNAETGEVIHRLRIAVKGRHRMVCDLCFSPDGRMLASAERGANVCLWDVGTGRQIRDFRLGEHSAAGIAFTPDSRHLVIGASGARDRVGHAATPPSATPAGGEQSVPIVGEIALWEIETGRRIRRFEGLWQGAVCVALSPDGLRLAAAGNDCVVGLWDVASGTPLLERPEPKTAIECLALSDRGKLLACGMHDGTVLLRDIEGRVRGRFPVTPYKVNDVCFSNDGRLVAAGGTNRKSADSTACVWSVDRATVLHRFPCGNGLDTAVAISPDGQLFAATNASQRHVKVWQLESGALVHTFAPDYEQSDWPLNAVFSPDSKQLIVSNHRNTAHTWDVASGKRVAEGRGGNVGNYACASSLDGRWIVNGGFLGKVQIWNPAGNGAVLIMNEAAGPESCCCFATAFSRDGRYVATAHHPIMDRRTRGTPQPPQIRIWELASGREVMTFAGHRGRVHALVFSADFRQLISGGWDTTVLVWPLDPSGASDEKSLSALWEQLADEAPRAYRAKWQLVHHPQQAVRLFAEHLKPVAFDPTEARRWAAQLDDRSFSVREDAFQRLAAIGELANGVLHATLEQGASLEVRQRIRRLLAAQHPILIEDKETTRACRAIEVLERIGSPEARELLDRLATGAAEATITRHAQAAKLRHGPAAVSQSH